MFSISYTTQYNVQNTERKCKGLIRVRALLARGSTCQIVRPVSCVRSGLKEYDEDVAGLVIL